jgi:hypothetical protein
MNQVFDFKRWLLLVGKHWSENRKKYLLSLAAIAALHVIWYSFMLMMERRQPFPPEMQLSTYYFGIGIVGCLFGSLLFSELASGPKAMHYMSVPASMVEKLVCALFYGIVLFFICHTAIFYILDFVMINIGNGILENYWAEHAPGYAWPRQEVINVFTRPQESGEEFPDVYFWFFLVYINLQSAFILGSVYFPTYSFIKTCISLLVVFLVVIFFLADIMDGFLPHGRWDEGFLSYHVADATGNWRVAKIPGGIATFLKYLFMYGFLPLFWITTYFRLKEKEV